MPQTAIAFGVVLCLVGLGFYLGTGATSVTALIPAFIGLPIALAGLVARREGLRAHAMHAAALVGTLGALGSLGRLVPALAAGGSLARPALLAQAITGLVCLVFVVLCVRSFVRARRARAS
jgi:hypothetical protein